MSWADDDLRAMAEHLGLESVRDGSQSMELILRGKNGNEARIWAWQSVDDGGMEFDLGTPTCICSMCDGRGWHFTVDRAGLNAHRHRCHCGVQEREDPLYTASMDRAVQRDKAYKAHQAAGLCTLHNGTRYCGKQSHISAESWGYESHDFTGPLVRP